VTDAPTQLNGYPVVQAHPTAGRGMTRPGFVVLVDRGANHEHDPRWITAWVGQGDRHWSFGHYLDHEADARSDYAHRCGRGY
jgi:hypothetical protein